MKSDAYTLTAEEKGLIRAHVRAIIVIFLLAILSSTGHLSVQLYKFMDG
jgi:hypothetical protein